MRVLIVDYGVGNLSSVAKAFETLNVDVTVSREPRDLETADRIVLPGVGAFGEGMRNLRTFGLIEPLHEQVCRKRKPFLGICLGMQLMACESLEHGRHQGLGWIDAVVRPFNAHNPKAIHMGWNEARPRRASWLFSDLNAEPMFYFVHGFHVDCRDPETVCATSRFGDEFVCVVQQDNLLGLQFHPEKSQESGLGLLRNFLRWNPGARPASEHHHKENLNGAVGPAARLIPTLGLHRGRLVKTVQFRISEEGIHRDVGDPVKAPMVYDAQLADELIYVDLRATLERRGIEALRRVLAAVSGQLFMPLTAGGGIRTIEDIRALLKAGADKVVINTHAVERPAFIREAAASFGSQCVVVAIDVRKTLPGGYEVFTHSGTQATGLDPVLWAQQAEQLGAGEIFLTAIDRDGTMSGYDLVLLRRVSEAVKIPAIASGGVGDLHHLVEGLTQGRAAAVAAASLFHFRDLSPIKSKAYIRRAGLAVRL